MPKKRYTPAGCASFSFPCRGIVPTVQNLLDILHQLTPPVLAEEWDNVGLLVGAPGREIHRVLVALDPTDALLDTACAGRFDTLITHHPAIFRPLRSLRTDNPIGGFLARAIREELAVIACHTNLDAIPGGVSDVLARALGLDETSALVPAASGCGADCGLGRIGCFPSPQTPEDFLATLRRACMPPWILEAGPRPSEVRTVAVCGGSCSDFAETARNLGAEVFVTAEVKHNVARWAEAAGLWLLDAGHFATEQPAMAVFADMLRHRFADLGVAIEVAAAEQHPPLRLA